MRASIRSGWERFEPGPLIQGESPAAPWEASTMLSMVRLDRFADEDQARSRRGPILPRHNGKGTVGRTVEGA